MNKRAAESELRLKLLYDAIEAGNADLDDPALKERIDGLKVIRDPAKADAERAQATLQNCPDAPVFLGRKPGALLSNMAMLASLRRMGRGGLTAHGFRSTSRDWAAESTNYPREVAEAALAHTLSDKVEAAYRRSDLIEKRSRLMSDRASFCVKPVRAGEVIPLNAAVHAA